MIGPTPRIVGRAIVGCAVALALHVVSPAFADVSTPRQRPNPAIDLQPGSGSFAAETEGEWKSPTLTIYDASACDFAAECALAVLDCADGLQIGIEGVDNAELARWLEAEDELSISVRGLSMEGKAPQAWEIQRSALDGSWSVIFRVDYTSDPGLTVEGDQLVIQAMPRTVALSLAGKTQTDLQEFVVLCARE